MTIIAITNHKGGVGKTSTSINLSFSLATKNKKTLIIDLDKQANSTTTYTKDDEIDATNNISHLFSNESDIKELIKPAHINGTEIANLSIIGAHISFAKKEAEIRQRHHREELLLTQLEKINDYFDYIILDCPPNLGIVNTNAINAADHIIIPTKYCKLALNGIADLFTEIIEIKRIKNINDLGKYYKILRNQKDNRDTKVIANTEAELKDYKLFNTIIRKSTAITNAQMEDKPVQLYNPGHCVCYDYNNLTKEVLDDWK